ncbi:MAG: DUF1788 domain-containing protein [Woeseiaceae bacterium]
MSIESRLNELKKDLLHPAGPSVSTNKNYPFALFQYPPHEEFKMRASLVELLESLRNERWSILNIDLFATFIELLSIEEDGELIEALIEEEKLQYHAHKKDYTFPINVLQNSLDVIFKDQDKYSKLVLDKIAEKTQQSLETTGNEKKTVIFLSRIGGLFPFYRTSSLLRYLDNGVKVPTIVLYPGERTEKYYLSFMGEMDADRDYRPRIY